MKDQEIKQSDFVEVYSISKVFVKKYYHVLIVFTLLFSILNWYQKFNEYNFYETSFIISDGGIDKSFFNREELFNPVKMEELFTVNLDLPDNEFQALRSDFNHVKTFSVDTIINNSLVFELSYLSILQDMLLQMLLRI